MTTPCFDRELAIDVGELEPQVTWGTNPAMVAPIGGAVPDPAELDDPDERAAIERALATWASTGTPSTREIAIDRVFLGSCTNARIEDLRPAATVVVDGRHVHPRRAMVVPGSRRQAQAEEKGLDRVFERSGLDRRKPAARCASE